MSGRDPMFAKRRPGDVASGVWSAGDRLYGGAPLVPGTGELLCMQPRERGVPAAEHEGAGTARFERAERAGLHKHTMW